MTTLAPVPSALLPGNVAVVTGAASGIGLAAAQRFAALGLKVALADLGGPRLDAAAKAVATVARAGAQSVLAIATDVSSRQDVLRLQAAVTRGLGQVSV